MPIRSKCILKWHFFFNILDINNVYKISFISIPIASIHPLSYSYALRLNIVPVLSHSFSPQWPKLSKFEVCFKYSVCFCLFFFFFPLNVLTQNNAPTKCLLWFLFCISSLYWTNDEHQFTSHNYHFAFTIVYACVGALHLSFKFFLGFRNMSSQRSSNLASLHLSIHF